MFKARFSVFLVIFLSATLVPILASAVPTQVSQQGRLVDDQGDGLTGTYEIQFSLFSDEAGTTSLWSESHSVELDQGYYSVTLGADSSNALDASVLSAPPLFLGMSVDGGSLMQPLLEVNSAPYAIRAGTAANLDGAGYADTRELYIDGTLVVDSNGDWVGNVLPGTLASLGCADGEVARYTVAFGWVCQHPGDHYTDPQAIAAMGALDNSNPLNHNRYSDSEAIAAVGPHYTDAQAVAALDAADAYVRNTGDTVTGDLTIRSAAPVIVLDASGSGPGAEWELRSAAEDFEIFQPSALGTGKTYLRMSDSQQQIQLTPNGELALTADSSGNVSVDRHVFGERYLFNARTSGSIGLNGVQFLQNDRVLFDHELADRGNVYDGAYTFTAPRDGYYSFAMSFTFVGGDGSDDTMNLRFFKNWPSGSSIQTLTVNPRYTSRPGVETNASMSTIVELDFGDQVTINGQNAQVDSPARITRGYFSGFYLGDDS